MNLENLYNKSLDVLVDKEELLSNFIKLLGEKMNDALKTLFERFDWQCSQSEKSAKFMYENDTMYGYVPEEGIRSALKHGTTVIGQLGLAETLQILVGNDQTNEKGMDAAKKLKTSLALHAKNSKRNIK